jgi:hypothetical protein
VLFISRWRMLLPIKCRRESVPKLVFLAVIVYLLIALIPFVKNLNNVTSTTVTDNSKIINKVKIFKKPKSIPDQIEINQLVNEPSKKSKSAKYKYDILSTDEKMINKYEKEVEKDLLKQQEIPSNGEQGKIAHLIDSADLEEGEQQLKKIAINVALSEHISYNRTIPDARHPSCRKKSYNIHALPTASVIIIFFNEPYSVLVRTVHSVINTTPPELLHQIILVDDGSSNIELKHKLDYYATTRWSKKVKIIRLKNR